MKENEINYETLKESTLYYSENAVDNKELKRWLDDNKVVYYLYKMNRHWKLAIDDEIIGMIKNNIVEKTSEYETIDERDGWLYIKIKILERVLSNLTSLDLSNLELDEFNLIKRNSKIKYNDLLDLKSDISNTGYTSILFKKSRLYILELRIRNKDTIYYKRIAVGKSITLKYALYTLLLVKCKILGIDCPDEKDIDASKLYAYANKLGYGDEKNIKVNKPRLLDYKIVKESRPSYRTSNDDIEKESNGTGYKNINLGLAEDKVYLLFRINKGGIKISKRKRLYTINDYFVGLKEYIDLYYEIYNIKQPKEINYTTGINSIVKSGIEIKGI